MQDACRIMARFLDPHRVMSKRVLIIDPSPEVAEQMVLRLQLVGYEVAVEKQGALGLETTQRFHPDLIFVDADLPEVNGFHICYLLKKREGCKVVVTGWTESLQSRVWAQEAGADLFLHKPYRPEELIEAAHSLA